MMTEKLVNNSIYPHLFSLGWIEGFAIFVAVFVVAFVGSWNDYQKEIQFIKLQAISEKDNIVIKF
jgi:hypothetical protein